VRVLVTADTFSGVWTYSRELVSGLVTHGAQVTLVSFGEIPLPHQTAWMDGLHGLEYHPTAFRLDWMQEGEQDFDAAQDYLCAVVRDTRPDFLHLNQISFGALPVATPRLVVAHGDVVTWWLSIHGHEPASSAWLKWYRKTIMEGLKRAEAVVSTSRWMGDMLRLAYGDEFDGYVIPPGRNPIYFNPFVTKEESVLAIGRLWDTGKQVALLTQHSHGLPVCIVGADNPIPAPPVPIRADVRVSTGEHEISVKGAQTESQLRSLYSKSTIFAATSRYEPTGLASIEAAFSRCALVARAISSGPRSRVKPPSSFSVSGSAAIAISVTPTPQCAELLHLTLSFGEAMGLSKPLLQPRVVRPSRRRHHPVTGLMSSAFGARGPAVAVSPGGFSPRVPRTPPP